MKPTPLTIEFPPDLTERVKAAARAAGLSEGEWLVQLVLTELPSNYASEVQKLAGLRGVDETGVDEA
ncbi:hypothetical protein BH24DEI2_BH24DEI2_24930 [soil metagenome]